MEPAAIADLLRRWGGICRGRQLAVGGADRNATSRAVMHGSILRIRDGVFATPDAPWHLRQAAAHGGELACVSALRRFGVWVLDDALVLHVWVGAHGRVHAHDDCRCVTHRDSGRSAFGVVPLTQALIQAARCMGDECFFAAFESAWRLGLLTRADRAVVRSGLPAGKRYLVDLARSDADSGLESILRLRLHRIGIRLRSQIWIPQVGRIDFLIGDRLLLEVDGRENHDGPSLRHKDLMRDAEAAALGYETLRFDYAMVIHNWPLVEAAILGRLAASGPR